jgi:hypothetical protein
LLDHLGVFYAISPIKQSVNSYKIMSKHGSKKSLILHMRAP